MKNYSVFLYIIVVIVANASATKMSSCSDATGKYPINVNYSINSYVCESTPCDCILGCESLIDVFFQAPRYLEHIKPKVHASCMGVEMDYPLNQDDACEGFTNTQCPIVPNELVNYQYKLTIPPIFPEVTVTLTYYLEDEDLDENFICFEWDVNVKKTACPT
ncbi:NPC intracellular cholesterol transporter 2 homolog a-like [Euwallacea fornicatus]|uniref:NPC intracellular cholesterol transporter 2 homolog a-like n=1 Tax=Euwallacea fornicatus TaxID=995702 RepID=UPI00338F1CAE